VDEHLFYYWRRVLAKEECAVLKWAEEPRFLLVNLYRLHFPSTVWRHCTQRGLLVNVDL
jgi:hypothetical protein